MYSTMSFSICELVDMKRDRHIPVLITPLTALSQTLRACAWIAILVVSTIHVCGLCLKIITGR